MSAFPGLQKVLKLGEHGTYRIFSAVYHQDGNPDDDPMAGDFDRPNFIRRPTGNRTTRLYSSGASCRFHCLQGMNEYHNKSVDELRYEDYLLNRNGCAGLKAGCSNKPEYSIPQTPGQPLFPFPANYGKPQTVWNNFIQAPVVAQNPSPFATSTVSPFVNPSAPSSPFTLPLASIQTNPVFGNVFGATTVQNNAPTGGIFGNPSWATGGAAGNTPGTNTGAQPSTGIFGTIGTGTTSPSWLNPPSTTVHQSPFQNSNPSPAAASWYTPPANRPIMGVFGTPLPATTQFSGTTGTQQNTCSVFGTMPSGSIFGIPTPQTTNVFGNAPTTVPQTGSIFGTPTNSSPFGGTPSGQQSSPFGGQPAQQPAQQPVQQAFNFSLPNPNPPSQPFQFIPPPIPAYPENNSQASSLYMTPQLQTFSYLTNTKLSSQSYPELPPLSNEQFVKYMMKTEELSSPGKNYEKIMKTAQVRSYHRTNYHHENRIQSWLHRMLIGGISGRANEKSANSFSPTTVEIPTQKFLHWTDPDLYLPESSKMATDETFTLKTSRWKTLRLLNQGLNYETGNRRSLLIPSKNQAGTLSSSSMDESVVIPDDPNIVFARTLEGQASNNSVQVQDVHNLDGQGDQIPATTVILTKEKYYCNPSTFDLARRTNSNGACLVENFEVGHVEYGKVVFLGVMDVSGINLDDMIIFRHKELVVYPKEEEIPARGVGLNRAAVVTLEKVWPINRQMNALMRSMTPEFEKKYELFLRKTCVNGGVTFMSYEPVIGRWTFKVDQFSKPDPTETHGCPP